MTKKKYDFSGYATKNDLQCSDGRVILKDAFKHQDGQTVPLVWQHLHNSPDNVLGHATLENRVDGVFCYGSFNDTEKGRNAKSLVAHGDIQSLSIYANQLQETAKKVMHGAIREVSLVLSGANPGARIENISFAHGDGSYSEDDTEVLIYFDDALCHGDAQDDSSEKSETTIADVLHGMTDDQRAVVAFLVSKATEGNASDVTHADTEPSGSEGKTVQEVFDAFSEEQKKVVYFLIGTALNENGNTDSKAQHSTEGEKNMHTNLFDKPEGSTSENFLTHDQLTEIVLDAKKHGSLKESFIAHATDYGIDPIDVLFPDVKDVTAGGPATITRDTTWVDEVLSSTNHTPFSRIRTRIADLTAEEARAKGYVTGTLKKDDVITLMKRITTPTTIYKKTKLDRDDMIDITDFDVVVWLKADMRVQLNEELARAVLISDGRSGADEFKINEANIRPIAMDDPNVFIHRIQVNNNETTDNIIDECIRGRKHYKGSGTPTLYIGTDLLTDMLLLKDKVDHRLYKTTQELASVLRVAKIVEVEPMNGAKRVAGDDEFEILGIIVNLKDYTIGADKGGQVAMFDDFDIDYNQYKYLIETRASGALTLPKSALVIERKPAVVTP